ncbi:MAG: pyridoxamine 5'-phosphate oxidase family protein [Chloroflexi bacterium]|nr:pyridoxamine 5'-phosphate oxidase family protein [Chloroflexota bacterium]
MDTDRPAVEAPSTVQRAPADFALAAQIHRLVHSQPFAVLCTQGQGQPYGSLVCYALSEDLTTAVFATPSDSRKYRLLSRSPQAALVVDDRSQHPGDLMAISALTATGRTTQLAPGPAYNVWARLLLAHHPYLEALLAAPSSALFRLDVLQMVFVSRFQQVQIWYPASDG